MIDQLERLNAFILSKGYSFKVTLDDVDQEPRTLQGSPRVWFVVRKITDDCLTLRFKAWNADELYRYQTKPESELTKNQLRQFKKHQKELELKWSEDHLRAKAQVEELFGRWSEGPAYQSDYLELKKLTHLPPAIVRAGENDAQKILVVPMFDEQGEMWNVQQMFRKGKKPFHSKARVKGLFHLVDGHDDVVYVGESYANCLVVQKVTGAKAYVSFGKGNMEAVLKIAIERHGAGKVVLLADWDGASFEKTGVNSGMLTAQKLSLKYKTLVAVPGRPLGKNFDFADLWVSGESVSEALGRLVDGPTLAMETFKVVREKSDITSAIIDEPIPPRAKLRVVEEASESPVPFKAPPPEVERTPDPTDFPTMRDGFFFKFEGKKEGEIKFVPDYEGFAQFMRWKYFLKAQDSFTYAYRDGYYHLRSPLELKSIANSHLRPQSAPSVVANFVEKAKFANFAPIDGLMVPDGVVNVANGILDVRTRELRQHSPAFFFKYKLPHAYDPNAKCPHWLSFLERTFEGDHGLCELSAEIFGYVLLGGHPFLHKSFLLLGEGRNGKGVYLDVLKRLIGAMNYSAIPLGALDKPFSVVQADGKLANIVTEVTMKHIESEAFKTAVAGEDLTASKKYMDEYNLKFTARLIQSANRAPFMGDTTTGVHEKFCVIPFNRYIPPSERIGDFAQRYLFPEMSGVMNWALDGLGRLLDRGSLPEVEAISAQNELLRREIDPVFDWFKARVHTDASEAGEVKITDLYTNYVNWCVGEKHDPVKPNTFSKRVCTEVRKSPSLSLTEKKRAMYLSGKIRVGEAK